MISSTARLLGCFLLALSASLLANAQTQTNAQNAPGKKTGSISGKVTLKGSGISGVVVGAIIQPSTKLGKTRFSAITDAQGNYRISDLPPGTYELAPVGPQFVVASLNTGKTVIVEEGEAVDGLDFSLVRGGVISGKVTNSDGQPLIEEPIHLTGPEEGQGEPTASLNMYFNQTDDRGMYRIFGLRPGKYKVSAGTPDNRVNFGGRRAISYKETYYPSVTDISQATVIELREGSEATNIDVVLGSRAATYTASGRILDGETDRPLANMRYVFMKFDEHGSSGTSGPTSNALGEFKIDGLTPGKYGINLEASDLRGGGAYADTLLFDVTDHDVANLVIKTSKGASVSGVVVLEGSDEQTARKKFAELVILAYSQGNDRYLTGRGASPAMVGADGSFTVTGLAPGQAAFSVILRTREAGRELDVARIERDGVPQPRTIDIKEREQVTGVRLIINSRTGTLQGVVKVGERQVAGEQINGSLELVGDAGRTGHSLQTDARGRFSLNGLPAGTYDLTVWGYVPSSGAHATTKQQVVINENQVTDLTLTLDFKPISVPAKP